MPEETPYDWIAIFCGPRLAPHVRHTCTKPGHSGLEIWWETGNGIVPDPYCGCEYPKTSAFREHLTAKPKRSEQKDFEMNGKPHELRAQREIVLIEVAKHRPGGLFAFTRKRK